MSDLEGEYEEWKKKHEVAALGASAWLTGSKPNPSVE